MIGTRTRGFRHLIRMAKTLKEVRFFFKHDIYSVGYAVALYVAKEECRNPYMSNDSDYLMIFNDVLSNVKFSETFHAGTSIFQKINELRQAHPYVWVVPVEKRNFRDETCTFSSSIFVPSDFDKKYDEFCVANKKQLQVATKYASINSPIMKYMFLISNGSKNFFLWAVNAYFKSSISLYLIEKILLWNDNYNQLSSKLKKGTITGYTNSKEFFELVREMSVLRRNKRANDVISMFNTAQKKILREYSLNDNDYETLSKFGKLSAKKKLNFIKKMSTIDDPAEILKQMSFLADVHFEWKKESLMEFLKNSDNFNCEVVIDKDNIVLLKVKDYETVKRLAKTTNWCISKDKKYWIEYVEHKQNATQYVLMDFSRKEDDNLSIVGFTTVHDRGITNAHDFQNRNLMQGRRTNTASEIKSFLSKFIDCSNIYGVLDKNGIKLSDVVTYEPTHYKWDRESMFKYLNECVNMDDYYIIYDDGGRVVLIVENDDVRYFLGDTYIEQRGLHGGDFGSQHIIFADFNKSQNDPEKLIFGVISHDFSKHESSCQRLYNDRFEAINQSFDSKLEEYGLPYDIICRNDNPVERFYNALASMELATLRDLLHDNKVKAELGNKGRQSTIREYINNVTFGYNSTDYIDLFYDNGYTLSDVIGPRNTGDMVNRIITSMIDNFVNRFGGRRGTRITLNVPSYKEIEDFKNGLINDYDTAFYVGYFLMALKIVQKETSEDFFYRVVSSIIARHTVCDLFDLILTIACDKTKMKLNDTTRYIISYAYNFGSPRVINAIKSKKLDVKVEGYICSQKPYEVKTTEMWVLGENGNYVVEGVNEEVAAHAPRRR